MHMQAPTVGLGLNLCYILSTNDELRVRTHCVRTNAKYEGRSKSFEPNLCTEEID